FIALAIILGAHVNAAIQAEWPAVLRRRGRIMPHLQPVGTPDSAPLGLTAAVHRDPEAAAALLDRLGYEVRRREPDDAPGDPSPEDAAPADAAPEDAPDPEPE